MIWCVTGFFLKESMLPNLQGWVTCRYNTSLLLPWLAYYPGPSGSENVSEGIAKPAQLLADFFLAHGVLFSSSRLLEASARCLPHCLSCRLNPWVSCKSLRVDHFHLFCHQSVYESYFTCQIWLSCWMIKCQRAEFTGLNLYFPFIIFLKPHNNISYPPNHLIFISYQGS